MKEINIIHTFLFLFLISHHNTLKIKDKVQNSVQKSKFEFQFNNKFSKTQLKLRTLEQTSTNRDEKELQLKWPEDLEENIGKDDSSNPCSDTSSCRTWEQIRNLAYCKSSLLVDMIGQMKKEVVYKKDIYYAKTLLKTTQKDGWSHFLFTEIIKKELFEPGMRGASFLKYFDNLIYDRICVPTDSSQNAWIDDMCPLDACGPKPEKRDEQKCQGHDKVEQEARLFKMKL